VHGPITAAGEDRFTTFSNRLSRLFGGIGCAAGGRRRNFNAGISQYAQRKLYISQTALSAAARESVVKKSSFAHGIFRIVNVAVRSKCGECAESHNRIAGFRAFD
jgi:hypothetical protein